MTLQQRVDAGMGEIWVYDRTVKAIDKAIAKGKSINPNEILNEARITVQIAKAMKKGGEKVDKIVRYTKLSRREVKAL